MQSHAAGQVRGSFRPTTRPASRAPVGEALEPRHLMSGLSATYFNNADFTGTSITRIDSNVSFSWGTGAPDPAIGSDTFSARWTGQVRAKYSERYTFSVSTDSGDKARVWVEGRLLVDTWDQKVSSGIIDLEVGRLYDIKVEYREDSGTAGVKVRWQSKSQGLTTIATDVLYPPSTPTSPLATSATQPNQIVDAATYGASGNGIANDSPALQKAIDALPAFGTLRLEPRTYKLNAGLTINKPMNLEGNGALLLLNTSANPENRHLTISSMLSSHSTAWSERVVAGQSTFHPTFAPGTFTVGQWVFVELGHDPYDTNEQHFTSVVPVTSVGTNSVTLGLSVTHDINNGSRLHRITPLATLATQVHVRDLKFDHVEGKISDAAIWVTLARNTTFDGISGRFNAAMVVSDSTNISIKNVNASLVDGHSAAGRVLTVWQSENVQISGVRADTAADKAVFLLESWARNTVISDVDIRWRYSATPRNAVVHFAGGSSGTLVDSLRIDNVGPVMLVGVGGQASQFRFGTVASLGAMTSAPSWLIDDLTIGAKRYAQASRVTKTIDLAGGWVNKSFDLVAGTIRSIKLRVSHPGVVTNGFIVNSKGNGAAIGSKLLSGEDADFTNVLGMVGTDYLFNDPLSSMKRILLYTPAVLPAGARLTLDIEYYPPSP